MRINCYQQREYRMPHHFKLKVASPESLLRWMDCIQYGWMNAEYEKHTEFGDEFSENFSLLLPQEVYQHKIGTCWEQTIFANYIFDHQFHFSHKMIFMQQYRTSTHTFLIFKQRKKWYHFEHALENLKGIHGPYNQIYQIIEAVYQKMEAINKSDEGYGWSEMNPRDFVRKLTCQEFLERCGYNYEKRED